MDYSALLCFCPFFRKKFLSPHIKYNGGPNHVWLIPGEGSTLCHDNSVTLREDYHLPWGVLVCCLACTLHSKATVVDMRLSHNQQGILSGYDWDFKGILDGFLRNSRIFLGILGDSRGFQKIPEGFQDDSREIPGD